MAPRNKFESEYTANFKAHEVTSVLSRQPQSQIQQTMENNAPDQSGLKKKDDLLKPSKTAVQENRALQHKAGLAPSVKTQDKLRYLSEYKKQFAWKKPLDYEAPILSAEKMIYGVHGHDHAVNASKVKMPKKTEYQLQFVKHPIITIPEARKKELDENRYNKGEGRSTHDLIEWQEPGVPAGKPSKRPPQPSPPVPKKAMVFQSEYHANFKSPKMYEYVKGSWVGVSHPQFPHPDEIAGRESKPMSNAWYQQVIELREKVQIYKARAREGSHFISLLKKLKENGILETPHAGEGRASKQHVEILPGFTPEKAPQNENVHPNTGCLSMTQRGAQEKQAEGEEKTRVEQVEREPFKTKYFTQRPQPTTSASNPFQSDHDQKVVKPLNLERSPDQQREPRPILRREAWLEHKPAHRLVIPPYGVSSSSATVAGSDSRSDISLSELEASGEEDNSEPERQAISSATRRLFTGRRQDPNENKKEESFSSDDERSIRSYSSKASDVLSVESMAKRRAMASETLRRARRRQVQL